MLGKQTTYFAYYYLIYLRNSAYPYYGLINEINRHYLQELGLRYVSNGACSITEYSNI